RGRWAPSTRARAGCAERGAPGVGSRVFLAAVPRQARRFSCSELPALPPDPPAASTAVARRPLRLRGALCLDSPRAQHAAEPLDQYPRRPQWWGAAIVLADRDAERRHEHPAPVLARHARWRIRSARLGRAGGPERPRSTTAQPGNERRAP